MSRPAPIDSGLVIRVYSGGADVEQDGQLIRATLRGKLLAGRRRAKHVLAPGDRVTVDGSGSEPTISKVLERDNFISRTAAGGKYEQVLYANIERLVVVGSVKDPPLRPGFFDRFLVAAELQGIDAVLVANKVDLKPTAKDHEVVSVYRSLGYKVLLTSVTTGEGLDELRAVIEASLVVFAGHSGVGKSTLLNELYPGFGQKTQTVSEHSGRGRHTTTQTLLLRIAEDRYIADTPGIRSFGLHDMLPDEIAFCFREFAPLMPSCRFKGCTHVHEPACAIKAAVADGAISNMRYQSYLRIADLLGDDDDGFEDGEP